ncbi:MAG: vWA domain-containing protein [Geminicoccaceae bacterium]
MTLLQQTLRLSGLALCGYCVLTSPLAADESGSEKAILILDASGSMWGQVDGTHKITIAREVIGGLLDEWNPKVELGISAYGHREKGNCADIETLAPVGPVDRTGLMTAIDGLNPKGKTPLTSAVRQAAETLRYSEERATVILVSDGKETCDADPCAVAAELESAGVDFTAHVVGFDVTEEEKAQLQCVADNTGGKFLSAQNSVELHEAMATTVQLVAEPAPKRVVRVQAAAFGKLSIVNIDEKVLVKESDGSLVSWVERQPFELKPGSYILATLDQEFTKFEIDAGENLTIDGNALIGDLYIKGMNEKVMVKEPDGTLVSWVERQPLELTAGSYVLATLDQKLTDFEIVAGEDLTIDANNLVGRLTIEDMDQKVLVKKPDGTLVSWVERQPFELNAGSYILATLKQDLTDFEIGAGEDLTINGNDIVGQLNIEGLTEKVLVREPDGTLVTWVEYLPLELKAGSYSLGTLRQDLVDFDIQPGEELVIELTN